jgi:hypothetical protein
MAMSKGQAGTFLAAMMAMAGEQRSYSGTIACTVYPTDEQGNSCGEPYMLREADGHFTYADGVCTFKDPIPKHYRFTLETFTVPEMGF